MAKHVANQAFLTEVQTELPVRIENIILKVDSVQKALETKTYYGTNAEALSADMNRIMKAFDTDTNLQLQEMVAAINDVMQWVVDIVSTGTVWPRITVSATSHVGDANMNSSLASASAGDDNYIDGEELDVWANEIDAAFEEIVAEYQAINTFLFESAVSEENWQGPTKDGGAGFGEGARNIIGQAIRDRIGEAGPRVLAPGTQAETQGTVRGTGSALSAWVRGQADATEAGGGGTAAPANVR